MNMAGKTYSSKNKDRLKSIPLGSGNIYMLPYVEGAAMPSDSEFELIQNMVGRTKNGATFNYSQTFYTAVSDDGVAKKRMLTAEQASFTWGIMTWVPDTVAKMLRTSTATTTTESGESVSVVEGGGVGNQQSKKYWIHFVGGDDIDGKITLTGCGENIDALSAAFADSSETVITPNFEFDPYDGAGHLYKLKMANHPNVTSDGSVPPELASLAIGSLTLSPEFDADIHDYTASTTDATNTITANAVAGTTIVITVNGNSITNGTSATWVTGKNDVVIKATNNFGTVVYTVVVTKSAE